MPARGAHHEPGVAPQPVEMPTERARHNGWATSPIAANKVRYTIAVPAPSRAAPIAHAQKPVVAAISAIATAWMSMPPAINGLRPIRSDRPPVTSWPRPQIAG